MLLLLSIYSCRMRIAPAEPGLTSLDSFRFHFSVLFVCVCDREIDAPIRTSRFYRFSNYIIFKIKITHIFYRTTNNSTHSIYNQTLDRIELVKKAHINQNEIIFITQTKRSIFQLIWQARV